MPAALTTTLGLDPARLGDDRADLVPRAELEADDALAGADLGAELARRARQRVGRRVRVEVAVPRQVDGAVERFRARLRHQRERLRRRGELDRRMPIARARETPRCSSASDSGLEAMRTLPTVSKTPSSR